MSTVYDESRRVSRHQFEVRLTEHGLPARYVGLVVDALQEMVPGPTTVALTDSELEFVRAAGIPDSVFGEEAEQENALYEAASAVALDNELQESLLTTREVARLLGKDPAHVRRMLASNRLMTAGHVAGQSAFPRWQFVDGNALPGLREVLAAFPSDYHPLDIQKVMTSPSEELRGRSPGNWLATGGEVEPVVRLVASLSHL